MTSDYNRNKKINNAAAKMLNEHNCEENGCPSISQHNFRHSRIVDKEEATRVFNAETEKRLKDMGESFDREFTQALRGKLSKDAPDYHQRFRDRFVNHQIELEGMVFETPETILTFMDDVVTGEKMKAYIDGANAGVQKERTALIEKIEGMMSRELKGSVEQKNGFYAACNDLLAYLRGEDKEWEQCKCGNPRDSFGKPRPESPKETECYEFLASSRMCERGTKCCVVSHQRKECNCAPEGDARFSMWEHAIGCPENKRHV